MPHDKALLQLEEKCLYDNATTQIQNGKKSKYVFMTIRRHNYELHVQIYLRGFI